MFSFSLVLEKGPEILVKGLVHMFNQPTSVTVFSPIISSPSSRNRAFFWATGLTASPTMSVRVVNFTRLVQKSSRYLCASKCTCVRNFLV